MSRIKNSRKRTQRVDFSELQKYVALTMGFLLCAFVIAQFVVLDLAGIHGPEITQLRNEQEEYKLEIELERARVNELTKSENIKEYASSGLGYQSSSVKVIQVDNSTDSGNIAAQSN